MSNDITKFKGTKQIITPTFLRQMANVMEEQGLENSRLRNTLHEYEEYGVLPSKVHVDSEPSAILSTTNIVKQVNDYRVMNLLSGTICKYDVNKRAEELGMVIMEGNYIKSVCEIYSKKIIIHSKTIAYFSNDCYKQIVDSFKPGSRFKF